LAILALQNDERPAAKLNSNPNNHPSPPLQTQDVFLRELVSNAADALDKARFLSLTNATALGPTSAAELPFEIRISADPVKKILTIRDTGIGMTRDELVANLGTIAKSGTAAFLEAAQKGGDLNLIGQFGVGFYSAYLVADYVEVVSRRGGEPQHVWESRAGGEFAVSADPKGEDLGRGTAINLHLKAEAAEYLQEAKLRELVQRYSEFISFPIKLAVEKTTTREEPVEEADEADDSDSAEKRDGVDAAVEEEDDGAAADEGSAKKPATRTVTETSTEWETLNAAQALWLRPPGEVDDSEYNKFFKALAGSESEEPLAHAHFRAEGDVDFKAVLYVPTAPPADLYDAYYTKKPRLRLYVRRVFIADSFEELLPKWLSWLVGLVDSDSMPLNVSREVLQMSEGLKVIRKKLVRKALEMVRKLSDADAAEAAGEGGGKKEGKKGWFGGKGGDKGKDGGDAKSASAIYADFWGKFGKALKMGVIEDASNRRRLLPLLRFQTSASGGNLTTLDAYVSRMKANQTSIFYLVGTGGAEELAKSPFVDNLAARGYEVVLFTDPLDEYMMGVRYR
jgi:heat shock protein beta